MKSAVRRQAHPALLRPSHGSAFVSPGRHACRGGERRGRVTHTHHGRGSLTIRRPRVCERAVPQARRIMEQEDGTDDVLAARAVLATIPALVKEAETAGSSRSRWRMSLDGVERDRGIVRRGAVTGRVHRRVHRIGVVLAGLALLMAAGHAIQSSAGAPPSRLRSCAKSRRHSCPGPPGVA